MAAVRVTMVPAICPSSPRKPPNRAIMVTTIMAEFPRVFCVPESQSQAWKQAPTDSQNLEMGTLAGSVHRQPLETDSSDVESRLLSHLWSCLRPP